MYVVQNANFIIYIMVHAWRTHTFIFLAPPPSLAPSLHFTHTPCTSLPKFLRPLPLNLSRSATAGASRPATPHIRGPCGPCTGVVASGSQSTWRVRRQRRQHPRVVGQHTQRAHVRAGRVCCSDHRGARIGRGSAVVSARSHDRHGRKRPSGG